MKKGGVKPMRLSTRGRYALRAMVDLAMYADSGPVPRNEIAERQGISVHYIEQLFAKLRKKGFIKSVRGPRGGYILARDAKDIRAGDIIRAVEGPIALVYCVDPQSRSRCRRMFYCVTHLLWKRLSEEISKTLDSITLEDLCKRSRELMRQ